MLDRNGPLRGLRVVEMAGLGPAPFACMMLADMGAEVVRIARPGQKPMFGIDQKHNLYDRSRQSVTLDLRNPDDLAQAQTLIARAEVVIEGFRPGVMERLGLGPEPMMASNPALVYGRMTGWGQDGPLRDRAGHDLNYMAISGALWSIGPADAPPPPPQNIIADLAGGGMMLLAGVLAAVLHARGTGKGQVVDACMSDGAALMMVMQYGLMAAGMHNDQQRGGNTLNGGIASYRCYETACGGYVALGPLEPQFYAEMLAQLGLSDDPRFADQYGAQDEMHAVLETLFRSKPRNHWQDILERVDACFAPVLPMSEAPDYPHNVARGTFVTTDGIVQPGPAPRFSATPSDPPTHGDAGMTTVADVLKSWA
ncbi:CaiB/BaiF CoA transferase family protein [Pseudosulfitobacter pseudonitzschiae]|uniref:CaiB/BaiF CoA transferase family protein n=1 Tax=Pseudosulfitobacter pseudonitzschiae TaxID=1402135 RepID=UPI001AF280F2|nr:CaiB/BaiF CoA-transferase family protein [Pseudosulfitobacter pseudonitzschiae]MBM1815539.1 CoA transferase [Pseudosulfitobacter pseudonitzschiae]MBM1832530.1 CoA transferase [Pseudosulfitobacter pseudonitzschiae]MBM1837398.1 CoA transferase [Pseudosulfitobacter pseudonitzschiae]MBM1842244.1 CoA transferase [Pseudosulfitobacter pseudonitzschiae]MBM1847112.1 CoA transferase [Pseudosulfitobacter pseudonitzschiae]